MRPVPHGPDEQIGFQSDIRPLFREHDRESMQFAFDLWNYDEVKESAREILGRLHDGSMPCDGAWTQEKIESFERWVESGMQP
jgi:hypothetical protein